MFVINDVNNVSISGSAVGSVAVTAGASGAANIGTQPAGAPDQFAGPWALSLGNLNVGGLIATSGNGGGGNSGTLTQANGTKIHSETLTRFTTTNNTITVANPGNNFGRVEIFSNPGANVTINVTEDGTMKVGNVVGRGNSVTLTSRLAALSKTRRPTSSSPTTARSRSTLRPVASSSAIRRTARARRRATS